ncbi:hypothetical protein LY76DRAFT_157333 [Colletotrichum caudatum]|nr:hypothetical protein LY76DRAFT_157333 [Colletotrichum caudatum]
MIVLISVRLLSQLPGVICDNSPGQFCMPKIRLIRPGVLGTEPPCASIEKSFSEPFFVAVAKYRGCYAQKSQWDDYRAGEHRPIIMLALQQPKGATYSHSQALK